MEKGAKTVNIAVIQAAPVLFNRDETVQKAIALLREAKGLGAEIIIFPESFIPAYPRGLSFGFTIGGRTEEGRRDWQRYYENAVAVPGPVTELLGKACKEAGVYLSIGVTEKEAKGPGTTLYCTNLFFGPDGALLGKHRKLKPTGSERCLWGEGNASTLTVLTTPFGKIGSLICWENYMPLARMALYEKGVTLYIAPTADSRPEWQHTIRHIALEGRCFVISCNQYVEKAMYPKDLYYYADLQTQPEIMCRGGSCIIDPMGQPIAGPVYDKEAILTAALDLEQIIRSRLDFDVTGHYARPDVFHFSIKET